MGDNIRANYFLLLMIKIILSTSLFISTITHAAPVYLIFEGAVEQSRSGNSIIAPPVGPSKLVLKADFDRPGIRTLWRGNPVYERIDTYEDWGGGSYSVDYFYLEFVSGPTYTGGLGNPWGEEAFLGEIWYEPEYGGYWQSFFVTQPDQKKTFSNLGLTTPSHHASPLAIGTYFHASGYSDDDKSWQASMNGHYYLTAVTDVPPPEAIPEPGTTALFLLGVAALGLKLKRKTRA